MITYTVFDPDDGSGITYRWYGGDDTSVYVHNHGAEVDAFVLAEDVVPSPDSVAAAVATHHADHRSYPEEPDDSPVDLGLDLQID
ncbi:hypothetical protein [Actinomarinicola tropica]|uniref:Uncharacterized protein n=1 Tax=Actinomarinicola tropica TaxID=2789776 RepID=A0A5Q2RKE9_9ACTN|nr:hypothetical protein [Actinomarinicola tropica]QGG95051.1 hypothetical protein GH723_07990 [Actinomarinicola tropica]